MLLVLTRFTESSDIIYDLTYATESGLDLKETLF